MFVGESFDWYTGRTSGALPLSAVYTENVEGGGIPGIAPSLIAGRYGGQALRIVASNSSATAGIAFMNRAFPAPTAMIGKSFAFKRSTLSITLTGGGAHLWRCRNAAGVQFCVGVNSDGFLVVGQTNYSSELLGTSSGHRPIAAGEYRTVDIEADVANSADVVIRLDGLEVLNLPGVDTQKQATGNATSEDYCSHTLVGNAGSVTTDFDDAYYRDDGACYDEPLKCEVLLPASDVGPNQWTPSTGSDHYPLVDDAPVDGDSTYLEDATVGHKDQLGLTNLSTSPDYIPVVQLVTVARKTDAGLTQVRANAVSGSTTGNGHTQTLAIDYGIELDPLELDPDTSAAWNTSGVNALNIEIETIAA